MVQCEVVGCRTNSKKEFYLYMFPKGKRLRQKWLERLNRANFNPPLSKYVTVCARHFKPEDFEPDEKNIDGKGEVRDKPKLKRFAAPSLHLKPEPEPEKELDKKTRHQRAKRTEFFSPQHSTKIKREPKVPKVLKVENKPNMIRMSYQRTIVNCRKRLNWAKDPPAIKWCYQNLAVISIKNISQEGKCFYKVRHVLRDNTCVTSRIEVLPPSKDTHNENWSSQLLKTSAVYVPNSAPEGGDKDPIEVKQEVEDDPLAVDAKTITVKVEPNFETSEVKNEPTIDTSIVESEPTLETSTAKSEATFETSLVESEPTFEVFVKVEPTVETNTNVKTIWMD